MAGTLSYKSRIKFSRDEIIAAFESLPSRALRKADIGELLDSNRNSWKLKLITLEKFISLIMDAMPLKQVRLEFPKRPVLRYCWGDVSTTEIVQTINEKGYFSHYTAINLHGLTEQIPKAIYFNIEQEKAPGGGTLTQGGIDKAFKGKMRISNNIAVYKERAICQLNGGNTGCLGVDVRSIPGNKSPVRVTNLERTLIDAAIRPAYSGGIYEVRKAFESAKDRVSINKLCSYLKTINYTYPYHQLIGLYLERTQYRDSQIKLLRQFPIVYDFYIDYGIKDKEYDSSWRVYFPKGF